MRRSGFFVALLAAALILPTLVASRAEAVGQVLLSGVVRGADGLPVSGVSVSASAAGVGGATVTTGGDGSYAMSVTPGYSYSLRMSVVGVGNSTFHSPFNYSGGVALGVVAGDVSEDVTLPRVGTLNVRVVDAGNAPLGLNNLVIATPTSPNPLIATTLTSTGKTMTFNAADFGPPLAPGGRACFTDGSGACVIDAFVGVSFALTNSLSLPGYPPVTGSANATVATSPTNVTLALNNYAMVASQGSTSGTLTVNSPAGTTLSGVATAPAPQSGLPAGAVVVSGALSYRLTGVAPGSTADVVISLPAGSGPNAVYKLAGSTYTDVTSVATISGDKITLHLTDGGLGDQDGTVNGVIVDPVVPVRRVVIVPAAASVTEGNSGSRTMNIPVSLSAPSPMLVTVQWATIDTLGQPAPGVDYASGSGTLTFAPGETVKSVPITIKGDTIDEPDERVLVSFSNATNATIGGFYGLGFGTIIDDDPPPVITPGAAAVVEGNAGTKVLNVPVTLSAPSGKAITVQWATIDTLGQPAPGVDYASASGTLTFAPGETAKSVPFTVYGDTIHEPGTLWGAEWGAVLLTSPTNAQFGTGWLAQIALALIVDDD